MVWDVDEVELVLLAFLFDQTQFQLDRVDFFEEFVVGMVFSKEFCDLFMCKLVMCLVSLLEFQVILQFCLMHLLLHVFPPRQGLLQLLRHPLPHLLLPLQLLLRYLHNCIKIDLNLFKKPQILLYLLVHLVDPIVVDSGRHFWLEFALEIP